VGAQRNTSHLCAVEKRIPDSLGRAARDGESLFKSPRCCGSGFCTLAVAPRSRLLGGAFRRVSQKAGHRSGTVLEWFRLTVGSWALTETSTQLRRIDSVEHTNAILEGRCISKIATASRPAGNHWAAARALDRCCDGVAPGGTCADAYCCNVSGVILGFTGFTGVLVQGLVRLLLHSGGIRKKAGRVVDAVNWLQRRAQHRVSDAAAGREASQASTLRRWVREVAFNDRSCKSSCRDEKCSLSTAKGLADR